MVTSSEASTIPAEAPAPEASAPHSLPAPAIAATDGELLEQFLRQEDRVALDRLIERHSAMVWRVCRATLRRPQDVEDAFQATFLLLVKNARSIRASESAAGWLYRVAYRTSLRARRNLAARREEALALDPQAPSESAFPDLLEKQTTGVLVEELMRLPAKYQTPLVLRYLEGQSRRAIADQTDTTIAAVQGRLARGKQLLRRRLLRRGVSLAAAMSVLGLGARGAAAAENAPARVLAETTSNSVSLAAGSSLAASAGVVSLFQEGVRAMLALTIGKPLASAAALAAVTLLLMPPGEAGEAGKEARAAASGALPLRVDVGSPEPDPVQEAAGVELVQATLKPMPPTAMLPAERIGMQSVDSQPVPPRAPGEIVITPPSIPAPAVFVPGPPVPPANDGERLARLLALRQQLNAINEKVARLGLPGESRAAAKHDSLWTQVTEAIEQLSEKQTARDLAAIENELAVLVPAVNQRREPSEAPTTGAADSPIDARPVDQDLSALEELVRTRERRIEIVSQQVAQGETPAIEMIRAAAALRAAKAQLAEARGDLRAAAAQRREQVELSTRIRQASEQRFGAGQGTLNEVNAAEEQAVQARLGAERLAAPEVRPPPSPAPPEKPAKPKKPTPAAQAAADPPAPKKVPFFGVMSAADAAKLRAVRDDLVFEELEQRAGNGEPLVRITEMVAPQVRDARRREGKRIEMNALIARTREHEIELQSLLSERRERLESTIVDGQEEAYVEAMKALRQNEQELQRLLDKHRSQKTREVEPPKPPAPEGVQLIAPVADGPRIAYKERNDAYGWSVHQLQERLNELLDPSPALRSDGDYGPLTEAAVKRFQESKGLPSNGFADEATRRELGLMDPDGKVSGEPSTSEDRARLPGPHGALHVVGTYQGADGAPTSVEVGPTDEPITLVLTSYYWVDWRLKLADGAKLARVMVAGYFGQHVEHLREALPDNVPLDVFTYFDENDQPNRGGRYFWAYKETSQDYHKLAKHLKELTGREITSFVGAYQGDRFRVVAARPEAGREPLNTDRERSESVTKEPLSISQYGPDSPMKQGSWNCLHEPTALNPIGWATVAVLEPGEHAPIKLPDDARPRPHVKFLGLKDRAAQFEIVDPGHEQHGVVWDGATPTRIRDVAVECLLVDSDQTGAARLLVIRRVPVGDEGRYEPLDDTPTLEDAWQLLRAKRSAEEGIRGGIGSDELQAY